MYHTPNEFRFILTGYNVWKSDQASNNYRYDCCYKKYYHTEVSVSACYLNCGLIYKVKSAA